MRNLRLGFLLAVCFLGVGVVHGQTSFSVPCTNLPVTEAIRKGAVKEAVSALETQALDAENRGKWEEASNCYRQASRAARTVGQLQKAISYGNKAFEMGERAGDPLRQANAIFHLTRAHRQLGQYAKAREWLERGIEIVKKIPASGSKIEIESRLYGSLGTDFLRSGENQKAIDYISYSLQVLDSEFSRPRRSSAGNRQNIQYYQDQIVIMLAQLGDVFQRADNTEEAIKTYERGLSFIKQNGLKTEAAVNFYRGLGEAYLRKKDSPRAQDNLNKALEIAERLQDEEVIQRASSEMGDLLRQTQKPAEAIPYYKKAIDGIESTRSLLQSEEFRSSFFENKRGIYSGMILAYLDNNNPQDAFSYSERARSRAFLDILGSKVQLSHGALLEEERALQATISGLQAKLVAEATEEEGESDKGKLRRELEAVQKAYGDFLSKVRKENKEQASLMNVEPLTLKEAQELLDDGVTLLEYFVNSQGTLLWVVEKDRMRFVRIQQNRKDLISKVGALRESVVQLGEQEKFKASSLELYKLLIQPALQHIRGKELLIIPHDVLHYVPFQALMAPSGRYLIEDYPIEYLSSASLMQFTKKKKTARQETVLAFGNPNLGDEAFNLRFAEREAKEVAAVYPKSSVLLREQATKAKAIALSPDNDILHFAVHAEFNQEDPTSSALLLAREGSEDGRLKVSEIFSLQLKADLVVLSACETGLGKVSSGDEIVGLTRAFIYAGTPSVITTQWKVNDRASYELMREFYSNLKTMKKSEALRQAQLKTMKEFPEPFFWAAYALTGEP